MLNLTDIRQRRKFNREFKQLAIEISNNRKDFTALMSDLDIPADLIYRWKREALANNGAIKPKNNKQSCYSSLFFPGLYSIFVA
jgi:transposase-like protein